MRVHGFTADGENYAIINYPGDGWRCVRFKLNGFPENKELTVEDITRSVIPDAMRKGEFPTVNFFPLNAPLRRAILENDMAQAQATVDECRRALEQL